MQANRYVAYQEKDAEMTKKLLIVIIFLVIDMCSFAQTNVYHKFPTSNAVWREESSGLYSPCLGYQYFITGDTNITGVTYHKLQSFGGYFWMDQLQTCRFDSLIATYTNYSGAFKEDTMFKKVFYIPSGDSTEHLLYNFNLNLGDSINNTYNYDSLSAYYNSYVMTVDSILVGNEYRRRLGIGNSWTGTTYVYLIEGIGSTFGLTEPIAPHFESGSELLCFMQNSVPVYPDTNYACDLVSNIGAYSRPLPGFSIFPNPFNTTTELLFDRQYKSIEVDVYNTTGKLFEHLEYSNCNKIQLVRRTLTDGLYFLRVTLDKNITVTDKVLLKR